jgi:predicted DNA-binding transcriptional regulator AlpA
MSENEKKDKSDKIKVREAAAILGFSSVYVHRLIEKGQLDVAGKIGKATLLSRLQVDALKSGLGSKHSHRRASKSKLHDIVHVRVPVEKRRLLEVYIEATAPGSTVESWLQSKVATAIEVTEQKLRSLKDV